MFNNFIVDGHQVDGKLHILIELGLLVTAYGVEHLLTHSERFAVHTNFFNFSFNIAFAFRLPITILARPLVSVKVALNDIPGLIVNLFVTLGNLYYSLHG
jgi:hypothetical protein